MTVIFLLIRRCEMLPFLKAEREELFRSFYLDCTSISFTVEDAAIWVIAKKQEYENLVNRYEQKSKMPYKASRQKNEKPFTPNR